jgi:hypothetical protein
MSPTRITSVPVYLAASMITTAIVFGDRIVGRLD